ncbi:MAG: DUF3857 domain-containing transglutaminase family protein [Bdellovibrionales bacterium]
MNRAFLILLAWAFSSSEPSHARWLTKQESGSVIEKFYIDYEVARDGTWTQTVDYVIRVQSEDSKVNASRFTIEYNAFTDKVEVLEAFTRNGKQKIPVAREAIEDRDKGEARDYDVQKVRSVVFPQVQIGSRLHIRYKVRTEKPLIQDRWSTQISLYPSYFVESFKTRVKSERPLYFEVTDARRLVHVRKIGTTGLEILNRKPLPGWVHAEKDPYFHPAGATEIWISTHKDWGDFLSPLEKDFAAIQKAGVPTKLKSWLTEAAKKKAPEDRILFLLEKMSHDFRYFGDWRRHNGGLVPRALVEIEKSRYGDCKDLSSLLVALLRALDLDARVALIRRGTNPWGEEPDYKLPVSNRFNHAIVRVNVDKNVYWLDPTNPVASLRPYPDLSGRPAWVMGGNDEAGRGGGGAFERLPAPRPEEFHYVHDYEYRFKNKDLVTVRVAAAFKGLAPYQTANDLMLSSRSEVLSNILEYFSEGQEISSFRYIKEPSTGRILRDMELALEYESGGVTYSAGKAAFLVIPDGFLKGTFYETEGRESDMYFSESPYTFTGVRRLRETRLVQEVPPPCRVNSKWMDLERTIVPSQRDVLITQKVTLKRTVITHDEYRTPAFRKLQAETKRCFYRSGVLVEPLKGALSLNER